MPMEAYMDAEGFAPPGKGRTAMAGKRKIPYESSLDGAYVGRAAERRKRIVDAAEREARLFCTGALTRALLRIGGPDGESLDGWLADAVMTAARDEGTPFVMDRPHRPRKGDDDDDLVGLARDDGSIEVDRVPDLDQALRLLGAAKGLAAGLRTLDGSDGVWYDFIMVYEAPESDGVQRPIVREGAEADDGLLFDGLPPAQLYGHAFARTVERPGLAGLARLKDGNADGRAW